MSDRPIFRKNHAQVAQHLKFGRNLFLSFQKVFILNQSMRQSGVDQLRFRQTLDNVAAGQVTEADWRYLMERDINDQSDERVAEFNNAIWIYPLKRDVRASNLMKLDQSNSPVCYCPAVDNFQPAASDDEEQENLLVLLQLGVGSRVMLRHNLWVNGGLVNGSVGTVTGFMFAPGKFSPDHTPEIVLVKFDNYQGPSPPELPDGSVPICKITKSWRVRNFLRKRTQFPLTLCWALTLHKVQGQTLAKAIVSLGSQEHFLNSSLVSLSRVRKIEDLLLDQAYNEDRFAKIAEHKFFPEFQEELTRLRSLV